MGRVLFWNRGGDCGCGVGKGRYDFFDTYGASICMLRMTLSGDFNLIC